MLTSDAMRRRPSQSGASIATTAASEPAEKDLPSSTFDFQISICYFRDSGGKSLHTGSRDERKERSRSKYVLAEAISPAICARSSSGPENFFSSRSLFQKWTSMREGLISGMGSRIWVSTLSAEPLNVGRTPTFVTERRVRLSPSRSTRVT